MEMKTPDITPAQIVAFVQPVLAVLVAFGVNLTDVQQAAILGLSTTISTALIIADAMIRRGRSRIVAAAEANKAVLGGVEV